MRDASLGICRWRSEDEHRRNAIEDGLAATFLLCGAPGSGKADASGGAGFG